MRTEFVQRQEQRLAITPAMLQAIEVLQLSTVELLDRIEAELAENETLVAAPPRHEEPRGATSRGAHGDAEARHALLHALPAPGPDVLTHVRTQLAMRDVDEPLAAKVLALAELLDERGYLTLSEADLSARLGTEELERARDLLRTLEPRGLGASGPVDAMLAQLEPDDPDLPDIERLLTAHLDELARRRVPDVARALGLGEDDVAALLQRIAVLDPRPGAAFHERPPRVLRVDLEVREVYGRIEVVVDDLVLPALSVDDDYRALAASGEAGAELRGYLRGKLECAENLIRAVEQRRHTLARVGAAIFTEQRSFLRHGERAIRPLRMSDVAERVGLHVSTISRAVAGKNVGTIHGVHELRAFFDGGRAAGGLAGRRSVLARLRRLIEGEDPRSPLSDDELAARLGAEGLTVARRTVAKYRSELGYPGAPARRRA